MKNTRVGQLLPLQPSDELCNQRGGCFVAGDSRVNENTALAAMHTVWVHLHDYYAGEIEKLSSDRPGTFQRSGEVTRTGTLLFSERPVK